MIEIDHLEFPQEVRSTLTAAMAVAGVTATVQSTTGFTAARYVLIGELGQETAEIVNESAVPTATTLTVAAVAYPHAIGTEVRQVLFNQWRLYGNATNTGTGSTLIETFAMDVSAPFTSYVNTGTEYNFYFVRPFDSVRAIEGATYSDGVALTTSYVLNSVGHIIRQAVMNAKRPLPSLGSNWAYAEINECLRVTRSLLKHWTNLQTYDSVIGQTVRGGYQFTMPTDIYDVNSNRSILGVRVGTGKNLTWKDKREWEDLLVDVAYTQVRTATAVNARTLAVDNSYDFDDDGSVSTGLVGLWNFNENTGTTAFDYTTNANNGTITGAAYVVGQSGRALDFDGVDDVVVVTDDGDVQNIWDTGGSFSCWINPDTDGEGDLGIIATKGWTLQVQGQVGSAMGLQFTRPFSVTDGVWTTAATTIPINVWSHIVVVYDNDATTNDPTVYINGTSVTVTETSTPAGVRTTDVGTDLRFGNNAGTTATFDGEIDEVRLYSRLLAAAEAETLHANPGGAGASVNIYINGVKHTINYSDIDYSATAGSLLGVPFAATTGSITVAIPADTNVWQNETEGTPTWYTVYDGSLYIWYLPDAKNDNRNVALDFFTEVVDVNSDGDTISFTEYDFVLHWLTWKLRSLDRSGGEMSLEDADYRMYQTIVNQMVYQELGKTGKYKMKPFLPNVTTAT